VDAQELPQALSETAYDLCPSAVGVACEPAACRERCALEVIDDLLATPGAVTGEQMDRLLDLRWQLRSRADAEAALRIFCELRLGMESRHYLAFFRIRRWIENHLVAAVRLCPAAAPQIVPVKLDHFCVEAIRRASLCAALGHGSVMLVPRLAFGFRVAAEVPAETAAL
jgi:hypothetical protein